MTYEWTTGNKLPKLRDYQNNVQSFYQLDGNSFFVILGRSSDRI